MTVYHLNTPLTDEVVSQLRVGDEVLLSGIIFTARDAAHKRLVQLIREGKEFPINLKNQVIYYAGPCPPKPGQVTGPTAPTSAYRMDPFAKDLYEYGLKATIGKGPRAAHVKQACADHNAIHFSAVGGMSTLLARCVKKVEVVAYEDLHTEAIRAFTVKDFPVLVTYDKHGGDIYEQEINKYKNYSG